MVLNCSPRPQLWLRCCPSGIATTLRNNFIFNPLISTGLIHPCTMILRTVHWFIPNFNVWGISLAFLYFNRFGELFVHKPGEHFLLGLLATLLSPLVRSNIIIVACCFIQYLLIMCS